MRTFLWHGLQGLHGYTWLGASSRGCPKAYGVKPTAPQILQQKETSSTSQEWASGAEDTSPVPSACVALPLVLAPSAFPPFSSKHTKRFGPRPLPSARGCPLCLRTLSLGHLGSQPPRAQLFLLPSAP